MKCPTCTAEMDQGKAYVRGTALGFLAVGLSHQHCWFESHATGKKKIIVRSRSGWISTINAELANPPTYHCQECGTSVIVGPAST